MGVVAYRDDQVVGGQYVVEMARCAGRIGKLCRACGHGSRGWTSATGFVPAEERVPRCGGSRSQRPVGCELSSECRRTPRGRAAVEMGPCLECVVVEAQVGAPPIGFRARPTYDAGPLQ